MAFFFFLIGHNMTTSPYLSVFLDENVEVPHGRATRMTDWNGISPMPTQECWSMSPRNIW